MGSWPPADTKRYLVVKVAVSETELAQLRADADAEGRAVAAVVRRRALSPWSRPQAPAKEEG